jgi:hypothetical protein
MKHCKAGIHLAFSRSTSIKFLIEALDKTFLSAMPSVVMLSFIIQSVIVFGVLILSLIMLNVVMLSVIRIDITFSVTLISVVVHCLKINKHIWLKPMSLGTNEFLT